jgi:hypothetical protein
VLQEPALPLSPCAAWVARSQVAVKEVYEQYPTRAFVEKIAGEAAAARNVVHRFLAACYGLSMQVPPAVSREGLGARRRVPRSYGVAHGGAHGHTAAGSRPG